MRTQNISKRLFRLFAVMIVFVMAFSQVGGVANAQGTKPPVTKEKVQIPANLDEVQNYYGRLGDQKGPLGIVVELTDKPAALVYAQNQGQARSAELTANQVSLIAQKQSAFMNALQSVGIQSTELFRTQKVYNGIWLRVDPSALKVLASMPGVKAIHPIVSKVLDHTTSVPLIGARQVWSGLGGFRGESMSVGVIDTGVDYIHTNFGGPGTPGYAGQVFTSDSEPGDLFTMSAKVVGGYDFVGDDYNADPDSPTYDPIPAPDPDPMDCNGHGSHVSGSVAGYGVNADGTQYVEAGADTYSALSSLTSPDYIAKFRIGPGVAPKADLYALRVFGCDGSTDVTELAIEWAMDPDGDSDFSDHLDVINMSLGSSFGSEYDTSAVASNNAADAGIIVVASAGNSGDVYYITGAPAVARYAISVASSVDEGAVLSAFEVTAAPTMTPAKYPASLATFGPQSFSQPGDLAYLSTTDLGCTPYPAGTFTGKIALINRGTCSFDVKVINAQTAGAIGVLIANNANTFPAGMGASGTVADPTIPVMMTTLSIGTTIKTDMALGTVTVLLTTAYPNSVFMSDPTVVDTVSSFSSRGVARAGTLLKPDISAPGDTIFSTASGSGDQGASFNGTSMASPHVAGVMALLKQVHPTWSVAELKALAMNTATNDLWTSAAHTLKHTPSRVGAGRVSAANATQSSVVAYYAIDPGQVSVAFGEVQVTGTQSITKSVAIKNKGTNAETYNVSFDSRYQANPGLIFTILDASNNVLSNPVTVPALSTLEIRVKVDIDATLLNRARDASIATGARQRFSEGGGYVTLTAVLPTTTTLRVPVHIAARPASAMHVAESGVVLPTAATGTFSLTPSGTPVDTLDDTSLVTVMELLGTSPNDVSSSGPNDAADLKYIGATSDYPSYIFAESLMYFGIATYGKWDTTNATEFDIYIDINEDSIDDFVVFNATQGFFTGTTDDVMYSVYCDLPALAACSADYLVNVWGSSTLNTNLFHNNVLALVIPFTGIGLVDGVNTDFDFRVVSFNRDAAGVVDTSPVMSYDVANQAFTAVESVNTGTPQWFDASIYSPTIDVTYDKAAIAANSSKGLLLLHHHNAVNTAEVLPIVPGVLSIIRANANPANTPTVDFTVTFSEAVTGVDLGDFALTTTGVTGASLSAISGSGTTYTVTANTGTGNGTIRLDLADNDSIQAGITPLGGPGDNGDFITGESYSIVKDAPIVPGVLSIVRANANPANTPTVSFTVTFSETVNGVDLGDFALTTTGVTGASLSAISGSGTTYTVTANTGAGNGTIRLDLADNDSILDADLNPLGGPGDNGDFTTGQPYSIVKVVTFADVPNTHFAWQYIERLYIAGITGGCGTGPLIYCPETNVTRAQMAIFLLRGVHGPAYVPPAVGASTGFADVAIGDFGAAFIKQLAAEGITSGCGSGNYCPNAPVTRAEMAIFLLRAEHGSAYVPPAVGASTGFADVAVGDFAAAFIKQLAAEGITSGCSGGNYCPNSPVTRAQMAIFLVKTFNLP